MIGPNLEAVGGYERISIKPDAMDKLYRCDGIIFDIDGVLLDVTESFREAISRTTQYFFARILGYKDDEVLISPEETQLFKMAGGFNNDWDLTDTVVLLYLAKAMAHGQMTSLSELRMSNPSLVDFTRETNRAGGGMEKAKEIALDGLTDQEVFEVEQSWDRTKIRRIFQEYYAGRKYCRRLYGFEPEFIDDEGLLEQEHVLIKTGLLEPWRGRIGVLTGRAKEEAKLALEITGLADFMDDGAVLFDDGTIRKPNPQALLSLADSLGIKAGIYFGDTADDLMTVNNLKNSDTRVDFLSVIILHREQERRYFEENGADMIASDVNEALMFIDGLRSGEKNE